jgi:hypothetical protein
MAVLSALGRERDRWIYKTLSDNAFRETLDQLLQRLPAHPTIPSFREAFIENGRRPIPPGKPKELGRIAWGRGEIGVPTEVEDDPTASP